MLLIGSENQLRFTFKKKCSRITSPEVPVLKGRRDGMHCIERKDTHLTLFLIFCDHPCYADMRVSAPVHT